VKGLYVGVPAMIGKNGIEEVMELDLNSDEKAEFDASINSVSDLMETARKLRL